MNVLRNSRWYTLALLVAFGTVIGLTQSVVAQQQQQQLPQPPQQQEAAAGQDGIEVLTRGPVHEAFAETITFDPEPGIVVPKAPPADIEELPPQQRPAGANLAWIPGYWAWDDERNDFLWLSGIWRALPPGRQWVPGYWGRSQQGAQWTSGYWADAAADEIDYLPEPPATVEAGPNVAATSADDIWLPGNWIWQQNRYAWRPGTWTQGNQDWDWVPDHYVWTPRGYVYVDGYYDYSVPRRGIMFAPVYFNGGLYTQRGFSYSPTTVINPDVFGSYLFLRPGYGHYYFGDYYGSNYANAGFSPWFEFQSSRRGYDPIYANQRWQNRRDSGWEQRAQANFRNLSDNASARPPRTWAAQSALAGQGQASSQRDVAIAAQLDELTQKKDGGLRFQQVDAAEKQQFGQRGQENRKFLEQRQQLEANAADKSAAGQTNTAQPARVKLPRSPYVAPTTEQLGKNDAPPKRHEVLKPNLSVEPQPRKVGRNATATTGTPPSTDKAVLKGQPSGQVKGQSQGGADGQQQRESKGQKKQNGSNGQQPGGSKGQKQSGSNGQQQGASNNQQQGGSKGQKKSGSNGQPQSGTGGKPQGTPQNQSTEDQKKKDKN